MAKARAQKKGRPMVELPECPVCLETISAPIFQCKSGHSICNPCNAILVPPVCPICRQPMTPTRNWQLEEMIAKATRNCPHQALGCSYKTGGDQVEDHVKECIYRVMKCPLAVYGKCRWSGALQEMLIHFEDFHRQNILTNLNQERIDNISVSEDDRHVYIVPQGKFIYILTIKICVSQQLVYWVVQLIGCKKVAEQTVYEINIMSLNNIRRKITYYDHCYSDAIETAEIFRQGKCCVLPLGFFAQFVKEKMVFFNLNLKRYQPAFTKSSYLDRNPLLPSFMTQPAKNRSRSHSLHRNTNTSWRRSQNDD